MDRTRTRTASIALAALLSIGLVPAVAADELVPSAVNAGWFDLGSPMQEHHVITLNAGVGTAVNEFFEGATMTFEELEGDAPTCVTAVDPSNQTLCQIPSIPAGIYQYHAIYSGNTIVAGSVSDPFEFTIAPDTVDATGVGQNYTTIYPVVDGYRDGLTLYGTRKEPIGVTVRVYNPAGGLVRKAVLATGTGKYSYLWNGRSTSGTLLADGKYRVTQTLRDAAGTSKVVTTYVNVSKKRLYTYTKDVTVAGSSIKAKGTDNGSVAISTSGGYARVRANTGGWAAVGYQLTMPSASVYKSISFRIYMKGGLSVPTNYISMQNFVACPYSSSTTWNPGCFDHASPIGSSSATAFWDMTSGNTTSNRYGKTIRGLVEVNFGTVYIYQARVHVVYGILK
jgi:FlgD Ig-like domain